MRIILIAAMNKVRTIGHQNKLPWHIKEDMSYFKKVTQNNTLIMGRKTWQSVGNLPGRKTIVISNREYWDFPPPYPRMFFNSYPEAIHECEKQGEPQVFVCGGAQIYEEALRAHEAGEIIIDNALITSINNTTTGDTTMPYFIGRWKKTDEEIFYDGPEIESHRRYTLTPY